MATVYALQNAVTQRAYIGCTRYKLSKRLREHRCLLRAGKHNEPELQEEWTRYGEANFSIKPLQEVGDDVHVRRAAEKLWMAFYRSLGLLYNRYGYSFEVDPEAMLKGIEASRHVVGRRWTPEANLARSVAQRGKPKGHGAKISATKQMQKRMRELQEIVGPAQQCVEVLDKEPIR